MLSAIATAMSDHHQRQTPQVEDQEHRRRRGNEVDLDARVPADQRDENEEAGRKKIATKIGPAISWMRWNAGVLSATASVPRLRMNRVAVERRVL